jgi:hypothetical protein
VHSPKRDHVRVTARVTNDAAATPRAMLTNGLTRTSEGSASVSGCSSERTPKLSATSHYAQFLI